MYTYINHALITLYALNQAHSAHHPVHAAYLYSSQITEPARGTMVQYLPCATEADRNYRGNRVVQQKANSKPIVYVTLQQKQYSGASFSILLQHAVTKLCPTSATGWVPYPAVGVLGIAPFG